MTRLLAVLIVLLFVAAALLDGCTLPCSQNSDCPSPAIDGGAHHAWCLVWTDGGPEPAVGRAGGACSEAPGGGACRVDLECGASKCVNGACLP